MKSSLLLKYALILPLILLADYVIMVILGCTSCLFGLGDGYYCGTYCVFGKLILLASAVFVGYIVWQDITKFRKKKQDGTAA